MNFKFRAIGIKDFEMCLQGKPAFGTQFGQQEEITLHPSTLIYGLGNDGLGKQLTGQSLHTSRILPGAQSYILAAAAGGCFRLLPSQSLILFLGEDNPLQANLCASPSALVTSVSSAS